MALGEEFCLKTSSIRITNHRNKVPTLFIGGGSSLKAATLEG